MGWIADAKLAPILQVAAEIGMVQRGKGYAPCPMCGAGQRGSSDKRGPVRIRGKYWRCFRSECEGNGSVVDMVGAALLNALPEFSVRSHSEPVRRWFASRGYCSAGREGAEVVPEVEVVKLVMPPLPPPKKVSAPAQEEVEAFYNNLPPLSSSPECCAYLADRRIDPIFAEDRLLAKVVVSSRLPEWLNHIPFSVQLPAIVVPMYNAEGKVGSLTFRSVTPGAENKSISSKGGRMGVVFSDGLGLQILQNKWNWLNSEPAVLVLEGEIDFLTWGTRYGDSVGLELPILFGVVSGSWSKDIAQKIPDDSLVMVRTHHDKGGEQMFQHIKKTIGPRCRVWRSSPPEDFKKDDNDLLCEGKLQGWAT